MRIKTTLRFHLISVSFHSLKNKNKQTKQKLVRIWTRENLLGIFVAQMFALVKWNFFEQGYGIISKMKRDLAGWRPGWRWG